MTNSFAEHLAKSRRLTVLRLLRDNMGSANESVLHTAVLGLGFSQTSRDDVRAVRAEMSGALVQIAAINEWRNALEKANLEDRIRKLETGHAKMLGWAMGAGAVVSLIISFLVKMGAH